MTAAQLRPARPANLLTFGAVANGGAGSSAANAAALNAFGTWARAESKAGRAVHVVVPPGEYHYDYGLAVDCLKGISRLVFSGHGAAFLQTSPTGFPWPVGCHGSWWVLTPTSVPRLSKAFPRQIAVRHSLRDIPATIADFLRTGC